MAIIHRDKDNKLTIDVPNKDNNKNDIDDFLAELDAIHERIANVETPKPSFDVKLIKYLNLTSGEIQEMTQYVKDTVSGYLHKIADIQIIPDLVFYTCIAFYHQNTDTFGKYGEYLMLDDDSRRIINSCAFMWNTAYGHTLINIKDNGIDHEWILKIVKYNPAPNKSNIKIGLLLTEWDGIPDDTKRHQHGNSILYGLEIKGDEWAQNDIIKMTAFQNVDDNAMTLSYYYNDMLLARIPRNISKQYGRLAVSLCGSCSLEILK